MGLLGESLGLGGSQASETEHSNLALNVTPLSGSVVSRGQKVVESIAHADDPVGHELDLRLPLLVKALVGEDGVGYAGAVERRVGIHRSDEDLQLTLDTGLFLWIGCDEGEGANTFAVETHVFREGLGQSDLMTLLDEVADGEGVFGGVSRGETLVRHIEEGEEFLLLDEIRDFLPLGRGWVNTSGVVGAGVQENDSTLGSILFGRSTVSDRRITGDATESSLPGCPLSIQQSPNRRSSYRNTCIDGPRDQSHGRWECGYPMMAWGGK